MFSSSNMVLFDVSGRISVLLKISPLGVVGYSMMARDQSLFAYG